MAKVKKIEETESEEATPKIEVNDTENSELRDEIKQLKAEAESRDLLEAELKVLKAEKSKSKSRSGGAPIDDPTAEYKFRNLQDPGISFISQNSHPKTVGGKNVCTRYACEDGELITLPIRVAHEMNNIKLPLPKWTTDSDGNKKKVMNVSNRFFFQKV